MTSYFVNEGDSFTITENLSGFISHEFDSDSGTYRPFKPGDRVQLLYGNGNASEFDFTNGSSSFWTTLDQNMIATWNISVQADTLTEGKENLWLEGLDSSEFYKVEINDTSTSAQPSSLESSVIINGNGNIVGSNNDVTSIQNTIINGREYLSDAVDSLTGQANINQALMGGNDFLEVTGGVNNFANGNNGEDYIVLRGEQGRYLGGADNDRLEVFAAEAGSQVNGNRGIDVVTGSVDGVIYRGGADDDILAVSAGTIWGDKGSDTFQAIAGEGVAIVQDYTAGEDLLKGIAGGSFTLTEQGLSYGVGGDQMLLLAGVTDASQVTVI